VNVEIQSMVLNVLANGKGSILGRNNTLVSFVESTTLLSQSATSVNKRRVECFTNTIVMDVFT
jgi:hypothetical protein